jgi:predicted acylesterase/phospholipase RssA
MKLSRREAVLGGAGAAIMVTAEALAAGNAQGAGTSVDATAASGKVSHKDNPAAWARKLMAASDGDERDYVVGSFAPDARFRFGNATAVFGIDAIFKESGRVVGAAKKRHHAIDGVWTGKDGDLDVVSVEADVTYTFEDGAALTLPVTSTIRIRDDGLIADFRIYMDLGPFREKVERMKTRR